jgi:16S rRNA (guanine966-N2)-methyltransferase
MTRIVAGTAKGRRLTVPATGTRPTSDRAREALFNTLRSYLDIEGAHVLDLFAGTGAVGLEALSRGAAAVSFVEVNRAAGAIVGRNIQQVGLSGGHLHKRDVDAFLAGAPPEAAPFDLVFADPPYVYPDARLARVLDALAKPGWLAEDALIVVERASRAAEPRWAAGIALVTQRRYGEGMLWYGRRRDD